MHAAPAMVLDEWSDISEEWMQQMPDFRPAESPLASSYALDSGPRALPGRSVHSWLAVEFNSLGGEYSLVATPTLREGALPARSSEAATSILVHAQRALMGRFGLPRMLHTRRISWKLEDQNG